MLCREGVWSFRKTRGCLAESAFSPGQAPPPVQSWRHLRRCRVPSDLVFEFALRFIGSPLSQVEPRRLPVGIRCTAAIGKTLLQFPVSVNSFVVISLEQVYVAGGQQ